MYLKTEITKNIFDWFTHFTDKYLMRIAVCIGVIAVFMIIKAVLTSVTSKIIKHSVSRSKNSDTQRAEALKKAILPTVKALVMTSALAICLPILSPPDAIKDIVRRVITSLFLTSAFMLLYGFASYSRYFLERRYRQKGHGDDTLAITFTVTVLKVVVIILGVLTVLQQWVNNISSLLAGLSIGGVALALAAQDTASNLFGAVTVMFDHSFDTGDYIEVAGVSGTVERMGMRSTLLRRADRSVVCIPNSKMASENIVNWSHTDSRRVDMTLNLLYTTPKETLQNFMDGILKILDDDADVMEGKSLVAFNSFAESSLDICVRYFTVSKDYDGMMITKNNVNLKIMQLAESMDIGFAFPARSVYVINDEKED